MSANNGGSAFPTGTQVAQNTATGDTVIHQYLSDGMTLRDYFAAKAPEVPDFFMPADKKQAEESGGYKQLADRFFSWRWFYADSMLKARES